MIGCRGCEKTFPNDNDARAHFVATHGSNRCQLCQRADAAKASNFCQTCKSVFSTEIAFLEGLAIEIANKQRALANIQTLQRSRQIGLRTKFLARQKDLFCEHQIPKTEECEKCAAWEKKDVRSSKNIIHVDLDT